ncbi:hypothetical protein [Natronosalvus halobius]|uniref:hypothetical protein n=1 Tax=Natronosalvus halobius TaxID=2953746 RepID=UPI00209DEEB5|nr:hypothetical protein [Natronosalvus halobius]USZ70190.1 hypothetical protein NGM15_08620 [Natronosalvus halobius]
MLWNTESVATDDSTVERISRDLGCAGVAEDARAVVARAEAVLGCQYDRGVLTVATLSVLTRRSRGSRSPLERGAACDALAMNPEAVAEAEAALAATLQSPADETDIRALRRTVITLQELLAAVEAGRSCAPYRPGSDLVGLDPALARLLEQPLDEIDPESLERHLERLEADLEMARLGVELYALLEGETESADDESD